MNDDPARLSARRADVTTDPAGRLACPLVQVETNVVVPVEEASPKEEYSAATIRPKIRRALDRYLVPLAERSPRVGSLDLDLPSLDLADIPHASYAAPHIAGK